MQKRPFRRARFSVESDCDNAPVSVRLPRTDAWLLASFGALAVLLGLLAGFDGRLAIAGAVAVAFGFVALADLSIGLALFTFLGFLVVVPNFVGQTLSVVKLAALPLLVSWLAIVTRENSSNKMFATVHPAVTLGMLVFVAWAGISYVWAEDPSVVLTSTFRYALAMILVFIVFTAVQRERDVKLVAAAMVLGSVGAAVYGLLNPAQAEYGQLSRLSGALGNPNELATALVLGIGLSGGLFATSKTAVGRSATATGGAIAMIALLLTGSRGGLIALAVMLIAAIALSSGKRLALTAVTLTLVLGGVGYVVMAAPEQSRERILHPGTGSGRTAIWTVGTRMSSENPVKGVGAGNFPVSSIHYLLRPGTLPDDSFIADTPKVAENTYLEVAAELGIPAAALFVFLLQFGLGCAIVSIGRFQRIGETNLQHLATAISVSLIGLLTTDLFASEEYARELWLLIGLGPALLAMAKRLEQQSPARIEE